MSVGMTLLLRYYDNDWRFKVESRKVILTRYWPAIQGSSHVSRWVGGPIWVSIILSFVLFDFFHHILYLVCVPSSTCPVREALVQFIPEAGKHLQVSVMSVGKQTSEFFTSVPEVVDFLWIIWPFNVFFVNLLMPYFYLFNLGCFCEISRETSVLNTFNSRDNKGNPYVSTID